MENADISYRSIEGFPDPITLKELLKLYSTLFKDADINFFEDRLKSKEKPLGILAYNKNELVGFKIGYPYNDTTFYSWIGGVLPTHRRQGIAQQLTGIQHKRAKEKGFSKLRTKSMNRFKPMMILNLKNGFDIVKVYTNSKGQTKIVFEKLL